MGYHGHEDSMDRDRCSCSLETFLNPDEVKLVMRFRQRKRKAAAEARKKNEPEVKRLRAARAELDKRIEDLSR